MLNYRTKAIIKREVKQQIFSKRFIFATLSLPIFMLIIFAVQYLLLIDTIPRSIGQYLLQQESEGQKNKKIKIFSVAVAFLVAVISILSVPFGVNMILPEYKESIIPIQIMSVAIIPLTISVIQQSEFLGQEKSRFVLLGSLLQTGSYFSLIIFLGQSYGLIGISIGFLSAAIFRIIMNILMRWYSIKKTYPR